MSHFRVTALLFFICCMCLTGCSVYMAANQPDMKDMSVLQAGTERARVLAELGKPAETWVGKDELQRDLFVFRQGYSKTAKTSRAFLHGVADVATLGLWEVVSTPTEMIFDGEQISVEVVYNEHDFVMGTRILDRK